VESINVKELVDHLRELFKRNLPYIDWREKNDFLNELEEVLNRGLFTLANLKEKILDHLNWTNAKLHLKWDKLVLPHNPAWADKFIYFEDLGLVRHDPFIRWDYFKKTLYVAYVFPKIIRSNETDLKRKKEYFLLADKKNELIFRFLEEEKVNKEIVRYFFDKFQDLEKEIRNDPFIESVCNQQLLVMEYCVDKAIKKCCSISK
jgi:hypothetical protein